MAGYQLRYELGVNHVSTFSVSRLHCFSPIKLGAFPSPRRSPQYGYCQGPYPSTTGVACSKQNMRVWIVSAIALSGGLPVKHAVFI